MHNIFVSYRRSDSQDVTGRIFDHLKLKFRRDRLFKDVDSIPLGSDFRQVLTEAASQCDVLLVVIGDDWLVAQDSAGGRRIDDPADYVHIEVRTALERGIPVIPVTVEGAPLPREAELPEPLRLLAFRNAIPVRADPDFRNDIDRLGDALLGVLRSSKAGRSWSATQTLRWVGALAVVAIAAVGLGAFALRSRPIPPGKLVPMMTTDKPVASPPQPTPADLGSLYFLGIGINKYDFIPIKLNFATEDIMRLRETLKRYPPGGRKVETITLLDSQATKERIVTEIASLRAKLGAKDLGIVAFSGIEGVAKDKRFYIMPVDGKRDPTLLAATGISTENIFLPMSAAQGQVLLILDTCQSGLMAREMEHLNPKIAVLASCSEGELSQESPTLGEAGGGLFTTAVVAGLEGEADVDHDGLVSLAELGGFAIERTRVMTRPGSPKRFQRQTPVISGDLTPLILTAPGHKPTNVAR